MYGGFQWNQDSSGGCGMCYIVLRGH